MKPSATKLPTGSDLKFPIAAATFPPAQWPFRAEVRRLGWATIRSHPVRLLTPALSARSNSPAEICEASEKPPADRFCSRALINGRLPAICNRTFYVRDGALCLLSRSNAPPRIHFL